MLADWRRERGKAVYFQALEQSKIPCPEPLPDSAERGGGGWGRGLPRSWARRSAPPGSTAEEERIRQAGPATVARWHPENSAGPRRYPRAVSPAAGRRAALPGAREGSEV